MSGLCLVGLIQLSARMILFVRPARCLDELSKQEGQEERGGWILALPYQSPSHLRSVVATALINNELSDHGPDRETAAVTATASILLATGSHSLLGKPFLDDQMRYILLVNA